MNRISTNSKNAEYSRVLELHKKKNKTQAELKEYNDARANNPEIDKALYEQDKAEALAFVDKVQLILKEVARGEKLSKEEQDMVDNDADLARVVNQFKRKMETTEKALKKASPKQRKQILNNMLMSVSSKENLTTEDASTVEMARQFMDKYNDDGTQDENYSKYKSVLGQYSPYEFYV
ncbi:hypothetical protein KBA27_05930 [bacterium]|nr:hypothetical protein [bacterium]